jgi:hypothetical protein
MTTLWIVLIGIVTTYLASNFYARRIPSSRKAS